MLPRRVASLLVLVALVAACGGTSGPTNEPPSRPPGSTAPPTVVPSGSVAPSDSVEPLPTTDEPSAEPTAVATESSAEPATDPPSAAAECSGTDENRDFYESVAAAVDWPVYCPVLPGGWFVDSGEYRLAGGGRMEIAYRGPSGARLELHEGAFCAAATGCDPAGSDAGTATFGDLEARLIEIDDGGWAVAVSDASVPYLAVGTGLSRDAFVGVAAGIIPVAD